MAVKRKALHASAKVLLFKMRMSRRVAAINFTLLLLTQFT